MKIEQETSSKVEKDLSQYKVPFFQVGKDKSNNKHEKSTKQKILDTEVKKKDTMKKDNMKKDKTKSPGSSDEEPGTSSDEYDTSEIPDNANEWFLQPWQRKKLYRKNKKQEKEVKITANKTINKKSPVIGNNENTGLTAVKPLTKVSLFVSRLSPHVSDNELHGHIKSITGTDKVINCENLEVKYPTYKSYKVTIDDMIKNEVAQLFKPDNWPKGILVKKWYEKRNSPNN